MLACLFGVEFWCQWFISTELCTRSSTRAECVLREDEFPLYREKVAQLPEILTKLLVLEPKVSHTGKGSEKRQKNVDKGE